LLLRHELIGVHEDDVGRKQRRQIDARREDRVEVDVDDHVGYAFHDRVELRKDCSSTLHVGKMVKIGVEGGEQVVLSYKFQLKAVAGFSLVSGKDFERAAIVGGDEQAVSILVSEVAVHAGKNLLHHGAHSVVRCVWPAVNRNVDQRFGLS
jgi:hypothetical protein